MTVRVEHADCLEAIPRLAAAGIVFDACVTDPPYHLLPTVNRLAGGTPIAQSSPKRYHDLSAGFMGQQWDGGDIAFRPETWTTVATVLRPGAFLLAFGGTRTYHRLACAIEDGGFVIQDCIMWLFGSGFPKRRDMLKPAYEPIVLAYKPGGRRTMQIDECRIDTDSRPLRVAEMHNDVGGMWREHKGDNPYGTGSRAIGLTDLGRWPANVCHDGSEEVLALFPYTESGLPGNIKPTPSTEHTYGTYSERSLIGHIDSGSAARFFYSAKADRQDRWGSRHPTVKPVELMRWLVKLVCPPTGLFLDPFAGSGTAAVAALAEGRDAILIEREDAYVADIRERIAFYEGEGQHSLAAKARRINDKPIGGLFECAE